MTQRVNKTMPRKKTQIVKKGEAAELKARRQRKKRDVCASP